MNFWKFLTESTASGLYLSEKEPLLATLTKERGGGCTVKLGPNVKQLDMGVLSSAIPAKESLIRTLSLSLKKESDIKAVLPFEIEPLLPFNEVEAAYDYTVVKREATESELALYITKKEVIEKTLLAASELGFSPTIISLPAGALASFAKEQRMGKELRAVIFSDEDTLITLLLENEMPIAQHIVKRDPLAPLEQEIAKALLSLSKTKRMTLQGSALFIGIPREDALKIGSALGIVPLFIQNSFGLEERECERYAIPLGLAMGTLQGEERLPNFRKESLSPNEFLLSYKKPLALFALASLLLTSGILFIGSALSRQALYEAKENYSRLLSILETPYSKQEELLEKQLPRKAFNDLSSEELERRALIIESALYSKKERIELYPDVPRVSDLLAYFTTIPELVGKGDGEGAPIDIKSFSYSMVKRPELKSRNERYRVKVDIEFTALNATAAREFHDFLLAPNDVVDSASDVKWSTSGELYKASFFLKNRSPTLKEGKE